MVAGQLAHECAQRACSEERVRALEGELRAMQELEGQLTQSLESEKCKSPMRREKLAAVRAELGAMTERYQEVQGQLQQAVKKTDQAAKEYECDRIEYERDRARLDDELLRVRHEAEIMTQNWTSERAALMTRVESTAQAHQKEQAQNEDLRTIMNGLSDEKQHLEALVKKLQHELASEQLMRESQMQQMLEERASERAELMTRVETAAQTLEQEQAQNEGLRASMQGLIDEKQHLDALVKKLRKELASEQLMRESQMEQSLKEKASKEKEVVELETALLKERDERGVELQKFASKYASDLAYKVEERETLEKTMAAEMAAQAAAAWAKEAQAQQAAQAEQEHRRTLEKEIEVLRQELLVQRQQQVQQNKSSADAQEALSQKFAQVLFFPLPSSSHARMNLEQVLLICCRMATHSLARSRSVCRRN